MTTKLNRMMLVLRSRLEETITKTLERPALALNNKASSDDNMFDRMMADWKNLTQMRKVGDKAIIPIRGSIGLDDPFAAYYGETSLTAFQQNLAEALADDSVKGIILQVFSPGGYVYGVEAAANAVYAARDKKRVIAYTDSLAASAAYWLISAANEIVLGSETAEVGSIGVYLAHFDYSEMLKEAGIKVTEVTAGEYKGIGSPYVPLSPEDQKLLQEDVNYVYTRFVNTVARNRGMEPDEVLKSANGLTFYGSDAVKRGLADSVNTFTEVLAMTTKTDAQLKEEEETAKAEAAKKTAAEKLALETSLAEANKQLAAFKAKEEARAAEAATAATAAVELEAKAIITTNLGREATAEEVTAYVEMSATSRKAYKAQMEEHKTARDSIAQKAGLTTEIAKNGVEASGSGENLIIKAAQKIGLNVVAK